MPTATRPRSPESYSWTRCTRARPTQQRTWAPCSTSSRRSRGPASHGCSSTPRTASRRPKHDSSCATSSRCPPNWTGRPSSRPSAAARWVSSRPARARSRVGPSIRTAWPPFDPRFPSHHRRIDAPVAHRRSEARRGLQPRHPRRRRRRTQQGGGVRRGVSDNPPRRFASDASLSPPSQTPSTGMRGHVRLVHRPRQPAASPTDRRFVLVRRARDLVGRQRRVGGRGVATLAVLRRPAHDRHRHRRHGDPVTGRSPNPRPHSHAVASEPGVIRASVIWGIVIGILQGATPLAFWWLDYATVYALGLAVIAAIYIGFAVADGRPKVIAVETGVASGFVIIAAAAVTGTAWLLVIGLAGHGLKDLWQHRTQFVANTRWWPPFCMVVDFVVAAVIVGEIAAGMHFR